MRTVNGKRPLVWLDFGTLPTSAFNPGRLPNTLCEQCEYVFIGRKWTPIKICFETSSYLKICHQVPLEQQRLHPWRETQVEVV